MRADRLVAILLLLQSRGQVTAAELAEELEISERTARRDLEALGMAGIPVYSQQGRGGGWRLAGGGRTDLSGLNAAEARALFLLAGPAAATPEVKTALRKLVRALPEPMRDRAEAAAAAVVVDPRGWDQAPATRPPPAHLEAVQHAVVDAQQVTLDYVARDGAETRRVVHPLGLAAKGSIWYLIADTDAGLRTFRVDRMTAVTPTGAAAVRPEGFDLEATWREIADQVEERRSPVRAKALIDPEALTLCRWVLGTRLRIGPPQPDGRLEVEVRGAHVRGLAGELAGFGGKVEIVDHDELRAVLREVGEELVATYGRGS